jgi:mRNA interferase RelE/StbE
MKRWTVSLTRDAEIQLSTIRDQRIRNGLIARLRQLENEPESQGKPLTDELVGYRSVRAVGQRYRIIYKVKAERVIVTVVALGMRKEGDKKDIYQLAKKLMRLGLLNEESD